MKNRAKPDSLGNHSACKVWTSFRTVWLILLLLFCGGTVSALQIKITGLFVEHDSFPSGTRGVLNQAYGSYHNWTVTLDDVVYYHESLAPGEKTTKIVPRGGVRVLFEGQYANLLNSQFAPYLQFQNPFPGAETSSRPGGIQNATISITGTGAPGEARISMRLGSLASGGQFTLTNATASLDVDGDGFPVLSSSWQTWDRFYINVGGPYTFSDSFSANNAYSPNYDVQVTSDGPVAYPPTPESQSIFEGQSATFNVLATTRVANLTAAQILGTYGPGNQSGFAYQWLKNGVKLPGETNTTFTIADAQSYSGGDYSLVLSNAAGTATSSPAKLIILPPPYLQSISNSLASDISARASQVSIDLLDAKLGLRASQSSLDSFRMSAQLSLDTTLSSRASQSSADAIKAKLDSFDLTRIDASVSSRASQLSLNALASDIAVLSSRADATKAAISSLVQTTAESLASTFNTAEAADQTALNSITGKLHSTLDVNLSSRASQAAFDDFTTNAFATLANNTLALASQTSLDAANAALVSANGKLDALTSTSATQASVDNANASLSSANGKLDNLGAKATTFATQSSLDGFQTVVNRSFSAAQNALGALNGKLDTLQTSNQADITAATAKLDVTVSSRATQASVDDLVTNTMVTLASNALTRSSQISVDNANSALANANGKLDALSSAVATEESLNNANASLASANGKLDGLGAKAASLATQSSLDGFQATVSGSLLLSQAGLAILQASANNLSGKLDALQSANLSGLDTATAKLEATVSSRASQASFDDLTTNSLVTLTSNVLSRASQASVDTVNGVLNSVNSKVDTTITSRASQSSVDAANSSLGAASTKLSFGLDTNVLSRASQASVNTANAGLTAANTSIGVLDGKLNSRLDSTVSSRSTQSSVDAANATLASANSKLNFGLDTNMVSRASEATLNVVSTNLNSGIDLITRIHIERQLADGAAPRLGLFYLPAVHGGHLEYVRDIVTDFVQRSQDAGLVIGKAASFLTTGNTAFSNRQYKSAYDNYALAYQAAIK